jgi:hypothetical protein
LVVETEATGRRSGAERWLWPAIIGILVLGLAVIGLRAGQELLGRSPLEALDGDLQQVQTTAASYLGRLAGEARGFYVLEDPAVVTAVTSEDGEGTEFRVQTLAADPFGVSGPLILRADQIVTAADVHPDSQLAGAYRQVMAPAPSATPDQ